MNTNLYELSNHPFQIAITKVDKRLDGGAFFLDFSRPLKNFKTFGFVRYLGVPVVHEGEHQGVFIVSVQRRDPNYSEIKKLWKNSTKTEQSRDNRDAPSYEVDGLTVIKDFAKHFPFDVQRRR
jgi:hypothetical protein